MTTLAGPRALAVAIITVAMQIAIAHGEVKNAELKTAIEAVDAIPSNSSSSIEATKEADGLRTIIVKLASQNEIDDLVEVIASDPTERNSWQVIARTIAGNVGFKKEQLPALKRLFLASVRRGQHWLTEGRSGHRDYTSHQFRSELAIQIHALIDGKRDIPESKLLAEDPNRWLELYLPEKAGAAAAESQNFNASQSVADQGATQRVKETNQEAKTPLQRGVTNYTRVAAFLLAGIVLALVVWVWVRKTSIT